MKSPKNIIVNQILGKNLSNKLKKGHKKSDYELKYLHQNCRNVSMYQKPM